MIKKITKKQLSKTRTLRKAGQTFEYLDFIAPDNNAYRVDQKGGAGLKEMVAFNKNMKLNMAGQVAMLEMDAEEPTQRIKRPRQKPQVFH